MMKESWKEYCRTEGLEYLGCFADPETDEILGEFAKDGGKVILCSHMGKPKGEPKPELSLAPVAKRLSEKLGKEVVFAKDDTVVGENAKKASIANVQDKIYKEIKELLEGNSSK